MYLWCLIHWIQTKEPQLFQPLLLNAWNPRCAKTFCRWMTCFTLVSFTNPLAAGSCLVPSLIEFLSHPKPVPQHCRWWKSSVIVGATAGRLPPLFVHLLLPPVPHFSHSPTLLQQSQQHISFSYNSLPSAAPWWSGWGHFIFMVWTYMKIRLKCERKGLWDED